MKPRDIADRSREIQKQRRLDHDAFLRKTFTLPVADARTKAREILGGYMTIVEN